MMRCKAEVKAAGARLPHRCPLPAVPLQDYCPLHLVMARRIESRAKKWLQTLKIFGEG